MANVKFLRGTQANLNTLISGSGNRYTEGAFYLTTDTDRLYIAQSASELVLLNSIVNHVASVSALPTFSDAEPGDFYYAEAENILCTKRTGQSDWTQINPDTYLTSTTSNTNVTSTTGGATVSIAVTDSKSHSSSGSFSIVGGGETQVTQSGNTITINTAAAVNTKYDLTAASNKITLTGTDSTTDDITLTGTGQATVTASSNAVTVSVPIVSVTETAAFDANGALNLSTTLSDDTTNPATATVTPIITLDSTATESNNGQYKFTSGTATLPVYTKSEVDSAITTAKAQIDAMTYKGTVSSSDATTKLASTGNVGDTYKASTAISITGVTAKAGDLIIAKGSDGDVTWDVVPSGDDQTITGAVSGTSASVSDGSGVLAGIAISGGTHIDATGSISGKTNTITIAQKDDYTAQTASGSSADVSISGSDVNHVHGSGTFTAVTAIETDEYGNVVDGSVATQTLTIKDTHANIQSVGTNVTASNNDATVQISVTDSDTVSQTGSFHIKTTGSVEITRGTNASDVNLDIVWGTFNT